MIVLLLRKCHPRSYSRSGMSGLLAAVAAFCCVAVTAMAQKAPDVPPGPSYTLGHDDFAKRAEKAYQAAKVKYQTGTNALESAWRFGVACYDWADFATTSRSRAGIAEEGIGACKGALDKDPRSVEARYYLGMNLGQLARTKELGALRIVDQMAQNFKAVLAADPKFDYAGADRNLGLLYLESPGWPLSIGSRSRARTHLQDATKIAPEYPENWLNLIDAEFRWADRRGAERDIKKLDQIWDAAKKQFKGVEWEPAWIDWEKRRSEMKEKAGEPPRELRPPRKF